MLDGKRTWIGLIVMIAGMLKLGDIFKADQVSTVINAGFDLAGALIAIYGNYKAHQKIKKLQR